ncbi:MAG: DUF2255 family protein [Anaerolineae bacterium]|nr:DUF2255 family protein [Anaerolineae bacterium]
MTTWTNDELERIGGADELEIAGLRRDGTLREPVTIWVVRVGDDLYIRSVRGHEGGWYKGTQVRHEGRIWAGGLERDVTFVDVDDLELIEDVDDAYRSKYGHYDARYVDPMVVPKSRAATLKLVPGASDA